MSRLLTYAVSALASYVFLTAVASGITQCWTLLAAGIAP